MARPVAAHPRLEGLGDGAEDGKHAGRIRAVNITEPDVPQPTELVFERRRPVSLHTLLGLSQLNRPDTQFMDRLQPRTLRRLT